MWACNRSEVKKMEWQKNIYETYISFGYCLVL